jgi:hypothetical protein
MIYQSFAGIRLDFPIEKKIIENCDYIPQKTHVRSVFWDDCCDQPCQWKNYETS